MSREVLSPKATRFYYEAHLFKDREGKCHFTFEVPHALGPGLPFRSYARPENEKAADAAFEAGMAACKAALNRRAIPYTIDPKYVD
jgi:hypothetical protein